MKKYFSKSYKKSKKQNVLPGMFFLSLLLFFSCNSNKTAVKNEAENALHDSASIQTSNVVNANQMLEPCHWSYTVEQNAKDEVTLVATAKIDSGWHLYSHK